MNDLTEIKDIFKQQTSKQPRKKKQEKIVKEVATE